MAYSEPFLLARGAYLGSEAPCLCPEHVQHILQQRELPRHPSQPASHSALEARAASGPLLLC